MIILDTNVISEPTKPDASLRVVAWLNRQEPSNLFLTSISVAEVLKGIAVLPPGLRKRMLEQNMSALLAGFVNPILPFDDAAARVHSGIFVRAKAKNYTLPVADSFIAAIAEVHGFAVATRDVAPFVAAGVPVINPWKE
jgi:predicted nucleic acid-binding protein